ncbi:ABC transporter ATP-binding protein [Cloacibacillus porcorum]|jgi:branched-chain amino acid transport system ATP-binding protein|uniref:ABC transporter ATP-binding protein n=1 Tax=Cloacibacillus porcorum TaxID=1197717 RepID=A0A1B2I7G5_9BACT|nr:ABC transporter ATP-binding protein [Cloacibacillus porcorum]ANZ45877.1 ABC transporter ATP-binding protein [Cloacibacillus porcorum]MCC8184442.1 ABC transporter ATP-binding protein [Cloacibacillus porcorum]MDY5389255.1 ABC transporter ATP-binding protein [Cloacibacillus porcorum]NMF17270.1 ABC transporter ATP-binding protein [Cloacibacillus porcorum]
MEERTPILSVKDLVVNYGAIQALKGASLDVYAGEIVAVIGANGAGKSTMMNAIMGDVPRASGEILLDGKLLPHKSYQVVSAGISLSPEGRKVFAPLTVLENLDMGAFPLSDRSQIEKQKEEVFQLFPRLLERKNQYAGTLSGGEQQMLAIGRALMAKPRVLLLDEPSLGLAPIIINEIFKELTEVNRQLGMTILIVEQNARKALQLSHRAYVIQTGKIMMEGKSDDLLHNPEIEEAYLGGKKK